MRNELDEAARDRRPRAGGDPPRRPRAEADADPGRHRRLAADREGPADAEPLHGRPPLPLGARVDAACTTWGSRRRRSSSSRHSGLNEGARRAARRAAGVCRGRRCGRAAAAPARPLRRQQPDRDERPARDGRRDRARRRAHDDRRADGCARRLRTRGSLGERRRARRAAHGALRRGRAAARAVVAAREPRQPDRVDEALGRRSRARTARGRRC